MKEILYGHHWQRRSGLNPALIGTAAVTTVMEHKLVRMVQPCWILDYEFLEYGKYRVRTRSAPWRTRQPHTAHLYPPDTIFWEDTRQGEEWRDSAWIYFFGGSRTGLENLVRNRFGYARFLDPMGKLGKLLRRIAEMGKRRAEQDFWAAQAVLCEALDLLVNARPVGDETYGIGDEAEHSDMSLFAERVDTFLNRHLPERITLPDIAAHLNVSISLLSHRYRQATGGSPKATLTRLRIEQTKALMIKGYPLKAIAGQLGFANAFHLSKAFKQLEGVSPREFIRRPHESR